MATEMPKALTLLANDRHIPMAVINEDKRMLGFQFHPEITPETLSLFLENDDELAHFSGAFVQTESELKHSQKAHFLQGNQLLNQAIERLLDDEKLHDFCIWFALAMAAELHDAHPMDSADAADLLRYQRHTARQLWGQMPVPSNAASSFSLRWATSASAAASCACSCCTWSAGGVEPSVIHLPLAETVRLPDR